MLHKFISSARTKRLEA